MNYVWQAQYNDGTILNQIDEDGGKHPYEDIDRSKLKCFLLMNEETRVPAVFIDFNDDGDTLVWTRRNFVKPGEFHHLVHIVGKKGRFIMALTDSGQVLVQNNFDENGLFAEVIQ